MPRRCLKWRVTYRIDVVSSPKVIRYSVNIALLFWFWFRFTDFWRAKEIKTSPTLIYSTSKKGLMSASYTTKVDKSFLVPIPAGSALERVHDSAAA